MLGHSRAVESGLALSLPATWATEARARVCVCVWHCRPLRRISGIRCFTGVLIYSYLSLL